MDVKRARRTARAYYARQFTASRSASQPRTSAWAELGRRARRARSSRRTSRRFASTRSRPRSRSVADGPLGSVSRAYFDPATRKIFAAFNYPGVVGHIGSIDIDTRRCAPDRRDQRAARSTTVASVAWDPDDRTLFYTTDNDAWRDLVRAGPGDRQDRSCCMKDARIGDLVVQSATDKIHPGASGIMNGICDAGANQGARTPTWEQVYSWPYGTTPYDLDVSPAGDRIVGVVRRTSSGKQEVQLLDLAGLANGDATPVARFDFGQSVPNNFTFSPDGKYLYRQLVPARASRTSSVTRSRQKPSRPCRTPTAASCGRSRSATTGVVVFRYTGTRVRPGARSTRRPLKDVAPDHVPRRASLEKASDREDVERRVARLAIPYDEMKKDVEPYQLCARSGRVVLSDAAGLQGLHRDRRPRELLDPLRMNHAMFSASFSPDSGSSRQRARPPEGRIPALRLARVRRVEQRRLL